MKYSLLLIMIIFASLKAEAQIDSSYESIAAIVFMDSLVVTATRSGFDTEDFIQMVQKDSSFFYAFHHLRFLTYQSNNDIKVFNKKGKEKATYTSITQQKFAEDCRTMEVIEEKTTGKFYKKKSFRYYTAKMYDRIFFTHGHVCKQSRNPSVNAKNLKGIDKHINELKKLMFKTGSKVDVPFIGDKTAIFDENMRKYYDYSIISKSYEGKDCYVFTATVKPKFQTKKEGKTIIKFIETYFEKKSFQVVARNYRLAYNSFAFDFDVAINVKLTTFQGKYVPQYLNYDGNWDVPAKKRETCTFQTTFYGFK